MVKPEPREVTAATFERHRWRVSLSLGEIGHIAHDGVQVVRAIRVVARDEDWNTFPHRAGPAEIDDGVVRFRIDIDDDDGAPVACARLEIRLEESCTVTAEIRPVRDLEVNRLGIVVLLSPALAGSPLEVVHPDGTRDTTALPSRIAPHQPARDISALRYGVDGLVVDVALEGDVFEMEDQRNWTDASFKVYNRPLALPFPYRVGPVEPIRQSARITVEQGAEPALGGVPLETRGRSGSAARSPIKIGTSSGRHVHGALPPPAPHAGPLLVELTADRASWDEIIARASLEADALGVPVDLRVVAAGADDLEAGLAAARALRLARVGVFDPRTHVTESSGWDALRRWRDRRSEPPCLVAGTRAHFTELNRTIERLPRDADLVAFSMTPMMHATDLEHVEESLDMQRLVAEDAVELADGIPVVIGPVTLRRRFNAVATRPSPGSRVEAQRGIDPLIGTEYMASWFERSVAAVSIEGVLGASWFEATGPRGLVTTEGELTPAGARWFSFVSET